jgi:sec-independent protein translocase protein TatB
MFGLSFGEILIILVVALLVLGPTGMPKLARTLGKGLRDFRRATGDIRGAFETEFYNLDQEVDKVAAATRDQTPSIQGANAPPVAAAEGIEPAAAEAALPHAPEAFAPQPAPGTAPAGTAARRPEGTIAAPAPNAVATAPAETPAAEATASRPTAES